MRPALALASIVALVVACAPAPRATASPTPPEAPTASPRAIGGPPFQEWTRVDLPDPAPGAYGGGTPSSVVAFHGGYLAVGSVTSCCDGLHLSEARGVLWTSDDGRAWTLHDRIAAFDHAVLGHVRSAGDRLVLTGSVAASATDDEHVAPAIWVSDDGAAWVRAADPVPSSVGVAGSGMLGVITTFGVGFGVGTARFVSSIDGLSWVATSETYPVSLWTIVGAPDGSAMALGVVPGPVRADGSGSSNAIAFRSTDGRTWIGPEVIARSAIPTALLCDAGGFVALGGVSTAQPDGSITAEEQVWRFTKGGGMVVTPMPLAAGASATSVFVAHDTIVAIVSSPEGKPTIRLSTDGGASWVGVAAQDPLDALEPSVDGAVETPGGLLAVGSRWDGESAHRLPVAWLAER